MKETNKMKKMKKKIHYLIVGLMLMSVPVLADVDSTTEAEKRYLMKMVEQLADIHRLSVLAQQSADPDARVTLDYVGLQADIQDIRRALEQHVSLPSRSPRRIEPLNFHSNKLDN
jgi:RAQPRD family integrative conjugative element protein